MVVSGIQILTCFHFAHLIFIFFFLVLTGTSVVVKNFHNEIGSQGWRGGESTNCFQETKSGCIRVIKYEVYYWGIFY